MNILANDGISPSGEQALRDAGHTLYTEFVDADNLQAFIHEHAIDGILVRSATKVRHLDRRLPHAQVHRTRRCGRGQHRRGIRPKPGAHRLQHAGRFFPKRGRLVMGHLFSLARFQHDSNRQMPARGAEEFKTCKAYGKGSELCGKTLGIVDLAVLPPLLPTRSDAA